MDRARARAASEEPQTSWQWSQLGWMLRDWLLGVGLLSFHVGLYLLVALALVLVNLYQTPAHIWARRPLLIWGIIVAVHAVLVGIFVTLDNANRMLKSEEERAKLAPRRATGRFVPRPSGRFSVRPTASLGDTGSQVERAGRFLRDGVIRPAAARLEPTVANLRAKSAARTRNDAAPGGAATKWPSPGQPRSTGARVRSALEVTDAQTRVVAKRVGATVRGAWRQGRASVSALGRGSQPTPPRPSDGGNATPGGNAAPSGPAGAWPARPPGAAPGTAPDAGRPSPAAGWGVPRATPSPSDVFPPSSPGGAPPAAGSGRTWTDPAAAWRTQPGASGDGGGTGSSSPPRPAPPNSGNSSA